MTDLKPRLVPLKDGGLAYAIDCPDDDLPPQVWKDAVQANATQVVLLPTGRAWLAEHAAPMEPVLVLTAVDGSHTVRIPMPYLGCDVCGDDLAVHDLDPALFGCDR